jgi:DNA adenine methylase
VRVLQIQTSLEAAIAAAHDFPGAEIRGIRDGAVKFSAKIVKRAADDDSEEEQRTVLGIVLEPETIDSQKDIYSADEIRETAWRFAERYQHFGLMHRQLVPGISLLETYLAPVDFEVVDRSGQKRKVKKGTWLLRVRVNDDAIWQAVKSGELDGFSIGGSAVRRVVKKPARS